MSPIDDTAFKKAFTDKIIEKFVKKNTTRAGQQPENKPISVFSSMEDATVNDSSNPNHVPHETSEQELAEKTSRLKTAIQNALEGFHARITRSETANALYNALKNVIESFGMNRDDVQQDIDQYADEVGETEVPNSVPNSEI